MSIIKLLCTIQPLIAWDLVSIQHVFVPYVNSWEAILRGVKLEYLGLNPNIQALRFAP